MLKRYYHPRASDLAKKLGSNEERLGRTIVRISPGPDTKSNGVLALRQSLEELKSQAREKLAKP